MTKSYTNNYDNNNNIYIKSPIGCAPKRSDKKTSNLRAVLYK